MVNNKIIGEIIFPMKETHLVSDEFLNEIMLRQRDPYSVMEDIVANFAKSYQKSRDTGESN